MNFTKLIIVLAHFPILITGIYALYRYKSFSYELKAFAWFIFFSTIIQLTSLSLWFKSINNMPLLHLYVSIGFVFLIQFYGSVLKGYINRKILWGIAIVFVLISLVNTLFFQNIYTFNSNALTLESVLIVIFSLFTFNLLLNQTVKEQKHQLLTSLNWINGGLFLYYSSCILLFYFGEVIIAAFSVKEFRYTWILHSFFSTVMYTCFIIAIWKRPLK